MRRYKKQISRIVTVAMLFAFLVGNSNMVYAMGATQVGYASKYITVKGNNMHLALYGKLDASGETFAVNEQFQMLAWQNWICWMIFFLMPYWLIRNMEGNSVENF